MLGRPSKNQTPASAPDQAGRGRATAPTRPTSPDPGRHPEGKGRPTPKRREAEAARKAGAKVPTDRKEAARARRARVADERRHQREAMITGDERYLPVRDKGPVRKFARDYVDVRISAAEFFLPIALLVIVLSSTLRALVNVVYPILLLVIVLDSIWLSWRLRAELARRFPQQNRRGATTYAIMRSLQFRRLRMPKPTVKRFARL
ncbi:MAG: DUF3043 domain-containing protein [Actinomycetes bacterium]